MENDRKIRIELSLPRRIKEQLEKKAAREGISPDKLVERAARRCLSDKRPENSIYLSAPVNALVEGYYRENTTVAELLTHGDFGLGTFNNLDGEMVIVDGTVYQAKADGFCRTVEETVETPFACVTFFSPDSSEDIDGGRIDEDFFSFLGRLIPSSNMLYAVRIEGRFEYLKTRSVPRQQNYRPLVEVARDQPVFEYTEIEGALIGFYTPAFMASLNVPGYHLHFLTADRSRGGHLLDCRLGLVNIRLQHIPRLELGLPLTFDYLSADLSRQTGGDLEEAER